MRLYYSFILLFVLLLTGCSKLTLENQDAKQLVIATMHLPKNHTMVLGLGNVDALSEMQNQGLLTYDMTSSFLDTYLTLHMSPTGIPYYVGKSTRPNQFIFKTYDIDFNAITGISINEQQKTATVRFSLKATNVTPVARILARTQAGYSGHTYIPINLDAPIDKELVFKKFDTGWQLASGSSTDVTTGSGN